MANPQFIPGPFGGIADGGGFQQGVQTAKSFQGVAVFTHLFTPTTVNVARIGWDHLHTSRFGPEGSTYGIPAQFGIPGIPQVSNNGGLPAFGFQGLATLGANNFLPSDETTQTTQVVDDFSKVYGAHGFKMGIEYQHVVFNTLQPAWAHGQFDYNGSFTDIPGITATPTVSRNSFCPRPPRPFPMESISPVALTMSAPPTSTKPTTKECISRPTSRTTGRSVLG